MSISVNFRGPMLFVTKDDSGPETADVVDAVIIPDASQGGRHPDGSLARPHTAGLVVLKADTAPEFIMLQGKTVIIVATGESGRPPVDDEYLKIVPLHDMANPPGTTPSNRVSRKLTNLPSATTVFMVGGRMSAVGLSDAQFEVPRHLKSDAPRQAIPLFAVWGSDADAGMIFIVGTDGQLTEVPLDRNVEIFLYEADKPEPSRLELTQLGFDPDLPDQDNDFKWLYTLLAPPGDGVWTTWLGADPFLPAPRAPGFDPAEAQADPARFPGTDTCDRARFRGA